MNCKVVFLPFLHCLMDYLLFNQCCVVLFACFNLTTLYILAFFNGEQHFDVLHVIKYNQIIVRTIATLNNVL